MNQTIQWGEYGRVYWHKAGDTHDCEYGEDGWEARTAYEVSNSEFGVWLPHSCDDWVIGSGTREAVVRDVTALRDALDAVLADLSGAP